ncbi:MAG TPA: N-6 DNA methylase, partial [Gemmatimonadaceae bacterium]
GLGLNPSTLSARVSTAEGALRALSIEIAPGAGLRDCVGSIARQLSMRVPHLLWLVIVRERGAPALAIATWHCVRGVPRIAAMVTERGRVVDSDAETLAALSAASATPSDAMRHMRWLDILGRDAVTRRFFCALTGAVTSLAGSLPSHVPSADSREIALLMTSRLIFLSFLETKGWLNADFGFLANGFAECMASGGAYQRRVLEPLFFGTLNTRISERAPRARTFGRIPFLNGGLFSRTPVERIHRHSRLTDDALGALFGDVLVRYRFTAREDAVTWSQAAIDPEMLGKVFESLMESGDRKRGGVYYTPQRFVERVTLLTLSAALQRYGLPRDGAEQLLSDDHADVVPDPRLLDRVSRLRILDPACGSGAFLVYALERVARLRGALGDTHSPSDVRRSVLTRSIFGVDSSPTAVWLCELRLWLSAVIECDERDPMRLTPLPNLDRQIRVGDSLSGDGFGTKISRLLAPPPICGLRDRYTRANGRRKISLGRRLDLAERARAVDAIETAIISVGFERREIIRAARSRDLFDARTPPDANHRDRLVQLRALTRSLKRRRNAIVRGAAPAFAYPTHFADVADVGGFDVIIGNPPWVRVHNMPPEDRTRYRDQFSVYRAGAWTEGARGAHATSGFAGQTDLAALFLERSTDLLAPNGTLGLLLPAKLWRSLAGGGARQLTLERTQLVAIEDHTDAPGVFEAAAYPSMLITTRSSTPDISEDHDVQVGVHHGDKLASWPVKTRNLSLDATPGSPWLLLPPQARTAFDLLSRSGLPLFESVLGRPHLGVKTGCNDAFLVRASSRGCDRTSVVTESRCGEIETDVLRPLVRGETLTNWRLTHNDERIIWTHDTTGAPLRELPPHALRWLARSKRALERRSDSRSNRWWSLFRVESADSASHRVVWADFGRVPHAAVIESGDPTVPLNTCYSVTCPGMDDALAFAAILNSEVAAAWLSVIAGIERRPRDASGHCVQGLTPTLFTCNSCPTFS